MMLPRKLDPLADQRLIQMERLNNSPDLTATFPRLKTLKIELLFFGPDGLTKFGEVRYTVNVGHAKTIFAFACNSGECRGGNFDLSSAVADAARHSRKSVEGELRCQGSRKRPHTGPCLCENLLRYKLRLGYH